MWSAAMDLARPTVKTITKQQLVLRSADSVRVRENPNSQAAHNSAAGVLLVATRATDLPCTLGT